MFNHIDSLTIDIALFIIIFAHAILQFSISLFMVFFQIDSLAIDPGIYIVINLSKDKKTEKYLKLEIMSNRQ